jgi:ribose-phosphate pyrophosphokinase
MRVYSGNSNLPLAQELCDILDEPLIDAEIKRFEDGEPYVELMKTTRGYHAVIIQSLSYPFAENLMDAGLMVQAAKLNGAKNITAVLPYYGGARQDRRFKGKRTAITAKFVAKLLYTFGAKQIVTADIHNPAIEGFFNGPFRNVPATQLFAGDIRKKYHDRLHNAIIVSPDAGGTERAKELADELGLDFAVCYKRRDRANSVAEMRLLGDVNGKDVIILDDMADTCGTLAKCIEVLEKGGAKSIVFYATHGVFSGKAIDRIGQMETLSEVVVTNTILNPKADKINKLRRLSIAPFLAEGIRRSTAER